MAIFFRPGAAELLQSLLSEARCGVAFVPTMTAKYLIPCTQKLLRHATNIDWTFEEHEAASSWVPQHYPQRRLYVLSEVPETKGVKNLEKGLEHTPPPRLRLDHGAVLAEHEVAR